MTGFVLLPPIIGHTQTSLHFHDWLTDSGFCSRFARVHFGRNPNSPFVRYPLLNLASKPKMRQVVDHDIRYDHVYEEIGGTIVELKTRYRCDRVYLLGWSWGAGVGFQYAARNRDFVDGVIGIYPLVAIPGTDHHEQFLPLTCIPGDIPLLAMATPGDTSLPEGTYEYLTGLRLNNLRVEQLGDGDHGQIFDLRLLKGRVPINRHYDPQLTAQSQQIIEEWLAS